MRIYFFQLELHLYNPQHKLVEYLRSKGIYPQAYSPLGSTNSPLFDDELVVELSKKYEAQPAHVLLAYLGQWFIHIHIFSSASLPTHGKSCFISVKCGAEHAFGYPIICSTYYAAKKDIIILPKSVTATRILSNLTGTLEVLPKLTSTDLEKLDGLAAAGKQKRYVLSSSKAKFLVHQTPAFKLSSIRLLIY